MLRVRYEVLQALDDGPIFSLYSARDHVQARDVSIRALKAPFSGEVALVAKLREVVARTSAIQHSGVERLYEVDDHEGQPFIVGEMPKGAPLDERLKKLVTFSVHVAVSKGIAIAEALEAVHTSGVVHGDVGSHNIRVVSESAVSLQLAGIWEAYSASPSAGAMALSRMAPYLAPEVSAGAMPSAASDVYSLGVLLFEMLTGRQPYLADTSVALAMKHATAPTPSVRLFNPSIPAVLEEIVRRAMSKDPLNRYPTASVLLGDLRVLQDALRFGKTATLPPRTSAEPVAPVSKPRGAPVVTTAIPPPEDIGRPARPPREDEDYRSDVPAWMKLALIFLSAVVVSMIGIWMLFNLNRGKMVVVPDLIAKDRTEAASLLRNNGLVMRVSREVPSEKFRADTIIEMDPPAADRIPEGGEIRVVVSSGSKFVEVPDLRGLTIDEARAALEKNRLELDERIRHVSHRTVPEGQIFEQDFEPRSKVAKATRIKVQVSSGRRPSDPEIDPYVDERYAYTLKIKTSEIDSPVMVRVSMTDARATTTVYEEMHDPEDEFEVTAEGYGSEVTFRIFYDGRPVKMVTQRAGDVPGA